MRRGRDVAGGTPVTSVGGSSPARPSYATVAAGVSSPGPWGAGLEIRSPDLGEVRIGRCDSGDLLVEFPGVNNVERGNIRAAAVSPGGSPSFGDTRRGGGVGEPVPQNGGRYREREEAPGRAPLDSFAGGGRLGAISASRLGTLHLGARPEERRRAAGVRAATDVARAPIAWRGVKPEPRDVRFVRISGDRQSMCWGGRLFASLSGDAATEKEVGGNPS